MELLFNYRRSAIGTLNVFEFMVKGETHHKVVWKYEIVMSTLI